MTSQPYGMTAAGTRSTERWIGRCSVRSDLLCCGSLYPVARGMFMMIAWSLLIVSMYRLK
jgi:hypothetical protein